MAATSRWALGGHKMTADISSPTSVASTPSAKSPIKSKSYCMPDAQSKEAHPDSNSKGSSSGGSGERGMKTSAAAAAAAALSAAAAVAKRKPSSNGKGKGKGKGKGSTRTISSAIEKVAAAVPHAEAGDGMEAAATSSDLDGDDDEERGGSTSAPGRAKSEAGGAKASQANGHHGPLKPTVSAGAKAGNGHPEAPASKMEVDEHAARASDAAKAAVAAALASATLLAPSCHPSKSKSVAPSCKKPIEERPTASAAGADTRPRCLEDRRGSGGTARHPRPLVLLHPLWVDMPNNTTPSDVERALTAARFNPTRGEDPFDERPTASAAGADTRPRCLEDRRGSGGTARHPRPLVLLHPSWVDMPNNTTPSDVERALTAARFNPTRGGDPFDERPTASAAGADTRPWCLEDRRGSGGTARHPRPLVLLHPLWVDMPNNTTPSDVERALTAARFNPTRGGDPFDERPTASAAGADTRPRCLEDRRGSGGTTRHPRPLVLLHPLWVDMPNNTTPSDVERALTAARFNPTRGGDPFDEWTSDKSTQGARAPKRGKHPRSVPSSSRAQPALPSRDVNGASPASAPANDAISLPPAPTARRVKRTPSYLIKDIESDGNAHLSNELRRCGSNDPPSKRRKCNGGGSSGAVRNAAGRDARLKKKRKSSGGGGGSGEGGERGGKSGAKKARSTPAAVAPSAMEECASNNDTAEVKLERMQRRMAEMEAEILRITAAAAAAGVVAPSQPESLQKESSSASKKKSKGGAAKAGNKKGEGSKKDAQSKEAHPDSNSKGSSSGGSGERGMKTSAAAAAAAALSAAAAVAKRKPSSNGKGKGKGKGSTRTISSAIEKVAAAVPHAEAGDGMEAAATSSDSDGDDDEERGGSTSAPGRAKSEAGGAKASQANGHQGPLKPTVSAGAKAGNGHPEAPASKVEVDEHAARASDAAKAAVAAALASATLLAPSCHPSKSKSVAPSCKKPIEERPTTSAAGADTRPRCLEDRRGSGGTARHPRPLVLLHPLWVDMPNNTTPSDVERALTAARFNPTRGGDPFEQRPTASAAGAGTRPRCLEDRRGSGGTARHPRPLVLLHPLWVDMPNNTTPSDVERALTAARFNPTRGGDPFDERPTASAAGADTRPWCLEDRRGSGGTTRHPRPLVLLHPLWVDMPNNTTPSDVERALTAARFNPTRGGDPFDEWTSDESTQGARAPKRGKHPRSVPSSSRAQPALPSRDVNGAPPASAPANDAISLPPAPTARRVKRTPSYLIKDIESDGNAHLSNGLRRCGSNLDDPPSKRRKCNGGGSSGAVRNAAGRDARLKKKRKSSGGSGGSGEGGERVGKSGAKKVRSTPAAVAPSTMEDDTAEVKLERMQRRMAEMEAEILRITAAAAAAGVVAPSQPEPLQKESSSASKKKSKGGAAKAGNKKGGGSKKGGNRGAKSEKAPADKPTKGGRGGKSSKTAAATARAEAQARTAAAAAANAAVPMTFDEKRALSVAINTLDQDHLTRVVEIIQASMPLGSADEEIEVDIDTMDTSTLRELQSYIMELSASGSRQNGGADSDADAW